MRCCSKTWWAIRVRLSLKINWREVKLLCSYFRDQVLAHTRQTTRNGESAFVPPFTWTSWELLQLRCYSHKSGELGSVLCIFVGLMRWSIYKQMTGIWGRNFCCSKMTHMLIMVRTSAFNFWEIDGMILEWIILSYFPEWPSGFFLKAKCFS